MSRILRFRMKDGVTLDDIKAHKELRIDQHGSYISKDTKYCFYMPICDGDISVNVGLPDDLSKWDDFKHVLVLDESFLQPYTPFYGDNYGKDIHNFPYLERVIDEYNREMCKLDFLEL